MRLVILKDKLISKEQLDELELQFADLIYETTGLTPQFYVLEHDFNNVPTEKDSDGDTKPSKTYFTQVTDMVHKAYGDWGTDSVVLLVHQDNWAFSGIWGTNISNVYRTYHVHLCRFDKKNIANSLGTLYHEWMHSLDALIKTHTGVEIDKYFSNTKCFVDWDSTCVHGNRFAGCKETSYEYIKWKDNTDALAMITPDLKKAYQIRKEMYLEPYKNVQKQIIAFLRGLIIKKKGVPRGT